MDDFFESYRRHDNPTDENGYIITSAYTLIRVKVAGVSFKNGRRGRQTILREIKWHDDPYKTIDTENCIDLVKTEYEGSPAVEVWVFNKKSREQIGYIPKEHLPFILENWDRYNTSHSFEVYGGGNDEEGKRLSYGASFTCSFHNSDEYALRYAAFKSAEDQRIDQMRKDYEKKNAPYKRAIALFREDYPELPFHDLTPVYSTSSDNIDVSFSKKIKGMYKGIYFVRYYPDQDAIRSFRIVNEKYDPLPPRRHAWIDYDAIRKRRIKSISVVVIVLLISIFIFLTKR